MNIPNNLSKIAWSYFTEISKIPRASGNEQELALWLKSLSLKKDWKFQQDAVGNVVITVPGCGNLADEKPLIIQGHLDMVCEKYPETKHDFSTDPFELIIEDGWVTANGTTLGADNGVAIAYGLAVADEGLEHRLPLELLFTVEEETGLIGANSLDASILTGRTVLNIDSEEEGTFIIGCAGGVNSEISFPIQTIETTVATKFTLSGLRGGHSGLDVGTRFNALVEAAKLLVKLPEITLHSFTSGDKHNAIPRTAEFVISSCRIEDLNKLGSQLKQTIGATEPNVTFNVETCTTNSILPNYVIKFFSLLENGIVSMNSEFPDIVQTSTSFTIAKEMENRLVFTANTRSSSEDEKISVTTNLKQIAEKTLADYHETDNYPGWAPQRESKILDKCISAYKKIYQNEPKINAIHAGLECGILGEKIETNELISIGPTIENPHSPEERLNMASFDRTYQFILKLVTTKEGK